MFILRCDYCTVWTFKTTSSSLPPPICIYFSSSATTHNKLPSGIHVFSSSDFPCSMDAMMLEVGHFQAGNSNFQVVLHAALVPLTIHQVLYLIFLHSQSVKCLLTASVWSVLSLLAFTLNKQARLTLSWSFPTLFWGFTASSLSSSSSSLQKKQDGKKLGEVASNPCHAYARKKTAA